MSYSEKFNDLDVELDKKCFNENIEKIKAGFSTEIQKYNRRTEELKSIKSFLLAINYNRVCGIEYNQNRSKIMQSSERFKNYTNFKYFVKYPVDFFFIGFISTHYRLKNQTRVRQGILGLLFTNFVFISTTASVNYALGHYIGRNLLHKYWNHFQMDSKMSDDKSINSGDYKRTNDNRNYSSNNEYGYQKGIQNGNSIQVDNEEHNNESNNDYIPSKNKLSDNIQYNETVNDRIDLNTIDNFNDINSAYPRNKTQDINLVKGIDDIDDFNLKVSYDDSDRYENRFDDRISRDDVLDNNRRKSRDDMKDNSGDDSKLSFGRDDMKDNSGDDSKLSFEEYKKKYGMNYPSRKKN